MNRSLALMLPLLVSGTAYAQACWSEWEYDGQWLIRANQCSENVSLKDFEKGFCKVRVQGDQERKAAKCPSAGKTKDGTSVIVTSVVARCVGLKPPGADGEATKVYYSSPTFQRDKEGLQSVCAAARGRWLEGAN